MVKGKPHSGPAGKAGAPTSGLIYPDHSFKYPKIPPAQPRRKFNVTTDVLQEGGAANTSKASNGIAKGSTVPSHQEVETCKDLPKDTSDVGIPQRGSMGTCPHQKPNGIHPVSEELEESEVDVLDCEGQKQEQPKAGEEMMVEVVAEDNQVKEYSPQRESAGY